MDRGQLRDAQVAFLTVMDEMPFPVNFNPRHYIGRFQLLGYQLRYIIA